MSAQYYEGIGRRKSASATGCESSLVELANIVINDKDGNDYLPRFW